MNKQINPQYFLFIFLQREAPELQLVFIKIRILLIIQERYKPFFPTKHMR